MDIADLDPCFRRDDGLKDCNAISKMHLSLYLKKANEDLHIGPHT